MASSGARAELGLVVWAALEARDDRRDVAQHGQATNAQQINLDQTQTGNGAQVELGDDNALAGQLARGQVGHSSRRDDHPARMHRQVTRYTQQGRGLHEDAPVLGRMILARQHAIGTAQQRITASLSGSGFGGARRPPIAVGQSLRQLFDLGRAADREPWPPHARRSARGNA